MGRLLASLMMLLLLLCGMANRVSAKALYPEKIASGGLGQTGWESTWELAPQTLETQWETATCPPWIASDVCYGPNVYAYVVQNPWSRFDPEGLSLKDMFDVIRMEGIGGTLRTMGNSVYNDMFGEVEHAATQGAYMASQTGNTAESIGYAAFTMIGGKDLMEANAGKELTFSADGGASTRQLSGEEMKAKAISGTLKLGATTVSAVTGGVSTTRTTVGLTEKMVANVVKKEAVAAAKGPLVYRELSAADRASLDAGKPLMPKGSGGTILDHVRGQPTGHISVSETAAGTARFSGGNGLAEIDVNAAAAGGAKYIPHPEVIQGVGDRAKQVQKVAEAQEALFEGPISPDSIRLIK